MGKYQIYFEAIHYMLSVLKKRDKLSIIKLLFLADKYQLLHIGRTIAETDTYLAMEHGPVASPALDVLNCIEGSTNEYNKCDIDHSALTVIDGQYSIASKIEYDNLSESDEEAIKYVCERFSHLSSKELENYTHQYPEWKQYEEYFGSGNKRPVEINKIAMFSIVDDKLGVDSSTVELIRDI